MRAKTYCDLYVFTKESFDKIAKDFPEQVKSIRKEAEQRYSHVIKQSALSRHGSSTSLASSSSRSNLLSPTLSAKTSYADLKKEGID